VPEVKNRVTGRSMGEHTEDMAKTWNIGRREQDELALESHQRAIAARDRGFFSDLIIPVDGVCTENLVRFDLKTESLNLGDNGRADIPLLEPGCLALQVQEPT
jgi:acetyl-CoA C-acetyltransferase